MNEETFQQLLQSLEALATTSQTQNQMLLAITDSLSALEEAVYQLSRPKRLVRDQSGKIVGFEPSED